MNKKIVSLALSSAGLLLASSAFAAYPTIQEPVAQDTSGFYVTGQLGWGQQDLENGHLSLEKKTDDFDFLLPLHSKSDEDSGLAGRIALGYNVNQYFGVELGTGHWSDGEYKVTPAIAQPLGSLRAKVDTSAYSVDLLGKVQYPFGNGFRIFAKGGIAYVNYEEDAKVSASGIFVDSQRNAVAVVGGSATVKGDHTETAYRPEVAVGVAYDFNEHWSAELAYSRIFGRGSSVTSDSYIPDLDMATVGVTYNI